MKNLWHAILDFFHIEHHPSGTLRVVQMADGKYEVHVWKEDEYYGGDWRWRRALLPGTNKYSGRYDTLDGAMELYKRIQEENDNNVRSKDVVFVHAQEDA